MIHAGSVLSCTEFILGKLKQKIDVVSFTFFQYEASSTVLYATITLDRGSRQARKERTAVVKA